jgi:hypothetical protein
MFVAPAAYRVAAVLNLIATPSWADGLHGEGGIEEQDSPEGAWIAEHSRRRPRSASSPLLGTGPQAHGGTVVHAALNFPWPP